jgi:acyl-CoA thioester hydrolase
MTLQTRWSDNDIYRHVNNAIYYHYVDTVVNGYLIEQGALDINNSDVVGLVVETRCTYFSPLIFPQIIDAGLRAARVGQSSVTYEIGLFAEGEDTTAAFAYFVHVYVGRDSQRPVEIPAALRRAVEQIQSA